MAPTTSTKKLATASPPSLLDRLTAERLELIEAAEQAGFEIANGEAFEIKHKLIFDALGWDDRRVEKHIGRCRTVATWQAKAGTLAERAEKADELRQAEKTLAAELPTIEEQIRALEARQAELQQAVDVRRRELGNIDHAHKALRTLVPEHIRDRYTLEERALNHSPQSARMREVESRIRSIEESETRFADLNDRDVVEMAKRAAETSRPDLLIVGRPTAPATLNIEGFRAWRAEERSKLPSLREEFQALKAEYDAAKAKIEKGLDCYIR